MTFLYGDPAVRYWDLVWERLSHMSTTRNKAWFMIENFNEITGNHEKREESFVQRAHSFPSKSCQKIVECLTFHTKKIHSHGWEKDNPEKLNVNQIEKWQMKNVTLYLPTQSYNFCNYGTQTTDRSYMDPIQCQEDKK